MFVKEKSDNVCIRFLTYAVSPKYYQLQGTNDKPKIVPNCRLRTLRRLWMFI